MKKNNTGTSNILGFLAFLAIIIKSVSFILSKLGGNLGLISYIADVILTIVALIVAWGFTKKCSKIWKIVYLIILILVIVGFVFGCTNLLA